MATTKPPTNCSFLLFFLLITAFSIQGFASNTHHQVVLFPPHHQRVVSDDSSPSLKELHFQGVREGWKNRNSRRLMIGSTAPICTYNECRGCKFKCRAEQIPVDANDPINSAYHYRCVCHR
ncbi:hypothetical protein BVC80_1611g33 [Macleaya cordata]|uniref:Stomagen C-terminal domain-containing protein n=1 Tax=Macleaya cordata TaxID=56857 RepID=A0A200QDY4_MACCD|nr:hypothetical protein BVC80_1611g33 [Macleaya cordata]